MGNFHKFGVAIITASDKASAGLREDLSGPAAVSVLEAFPSDKFVVEKQLICEDSLEKLKALMVQLIDGDGFDLVLTTGGTGFSPRDVTPEATLAVIDREAPGIPEAMRHFSLSITDRAMLSRARAGIRNRSLIVNMPGSPKAVAEVLTYILPALEHGLEVLLGGSLECAQRSSLK